MSQHYSNPTRANDPYALPDVETFRLDHTQESDDGALYGPGWYWHACMPGCLPDSDPIGPFPSEQDALDDAREGCDDDDSEGN